MRKAGRPEKEINKEVFEKLCAYFCTQKEICTVLDISEKTLRKYCLKTYKQNFKDVYNRLTAPAKIEIRKAQFKAAENGDPTMLIWLGMNYLDQRPGKRKL